MLVSRYQSVGAHRSGKPLEGCQGCGERHAPPLVGDGLHPSAPDSAEEDAGGKYRCMSLGRDTLLQCRVDAMRLFQRSSCCSSRSICCCAPKEMTTTTNKNVFLVGLLVAVADHGGGARVIHEPCRCTCVSVLSAPHLVAARRWACRRGAWPMYRAREVRNAGAGVGEAMLLRCRIQPACG
jgi:hypothetical protein